MTLSELNAYLAERYDPENIPTDFHDLVEYASQHESEPVDAGEIERLNAEIERLKRSNLAALFTTAGQGKEEVKEEIEEVKDEPEDKEKIKTIDEIIKEGVEY